MPLTIKHDDQISTSWLKFRYYRNFKLAVTASTGTASVAVKTAFESHVQQSRWPGALELLPTLSNLTSFSSLNQNPLQVYQAIKKKNIYARIITMYSTRKAVVKLVL